MLKRESKGFCQREDDGRRKREKDGKEDPNLTPERMRRESKRMKVVLSNISIKLKRSSTVAAQFLMQACLVRSGPFKVFERA